MDLRALLQGPEVFVPKLHPCSILFRFSQLVARAKMASKITEVQVPNECLASFEGVFVGFLHTAKLRRSSNGANVKSDLPFDRNSMAMRPNCQPSRLSLHPHLEQVLLGKEGGQNPPDLDHHSSTQSLGQLEDLYMVDFDPQKCCIVLG